ncbi:MAG: hypothetical protein KF687_15910 [Cyclobacteriaceae bacterium]|nr:hypothetical protein [Cyclobacteriaceae bacterium]
MKNYLLSIILSGILVLLFSMVMLYTAIFFFPTLMEEYYNAVFRSSSFETDWLFYAHPFVLSFALRWFWERYKDIFTGGVVMRAIEVALVYGIVAMLPVLWLTFSAIDISFVMIFTWLVYGIIQAFIAGIVFASMKPKA